MLTFLVVVYLFFGLVLATRLALDEIDKPDSMGPGPLLIMIAIFTVGWLPMLLAEKWRQSDQGK